MNRAFHLLWMTVTIVSLGGLFVLHVLASIPIGELRYLSQNATVACSIYLLMMPAGIGFYLNRICSASSPHPVARYYYVVCSLLALASTFAVVVGAIVIPALALAVAIEN
jgi:hypothetical protein